MVYLKYAVWIERVAYERRNHNIVKMVVYVEYFFLITREFRTLGNVIEILIYSTFLIHIYNSLCNQTWTVCSANSKCK